MISRRELLGALLALGASRAVRADTDVRSFSTWGHRHCVEAVAEGLADGAAVDGYVRETLARRESLLTARTRVVLRSPLFGFPPLVGCPRSGGRGRGGGAPCAPGPGR